MEHGSSSILKSEFGGNNLGDNPVDDVSLTVLEIVYE